MHGIVLLTAGAVFAYLGMRAIQDFQLKPLLEVLLAIASAAEGFKSIRVGIARHKLYLP